MSWRYSVVGSGEFPLDMLRRDGANFADLTEESRGLHAINRRVIRLASIRKPNVPRWNSFGWHAEGLVETRGYVTPYAPPAIDPELQHGEYQPKTIAEAW